MIEIDAKSVVAELSDKDQANKKVILIDIRRDDELAGTSVAGAVHMPRDMLEINLAQQGISKETTIYLLCQSGQRSRFAAGALRHFGYSDTWSVEGGFLAWRERNLPLQSIPYLDASLRQRFARQLSLSDFGIEGQYRLNRANVLLIGAGGLSSPAALYLAAMGVGTIQIVDDDQVELSNLQRQILHTEAMVGKPKVLSAAQRLNSINKEVKVLTHQRKFDDECGDLVRDADVVINGADNFTARYTVNDLCLRYAKPMIDGSVLEMEGQLSVFCHPDGPCYRCLYPEPPPADIAPSCVMAGVLGVVPGVIGILQALEAVKLIAGVGQPLIGRLLSFDAAAGAFRELRFLREDTCCCSSLQNELSREALA